MTRSRFVLASPVAFLAGVLLVHCSSSSSTTVTASSGSSSGGSSSSAHASASASLGATGSATASGATSLASKSGGSSGAAGSSKKSDTYDAGPCIGPEGGAPCDPGNIECDNAPCATPSNQCCYGSGSSSTCEDVATKCAGNPQQCDEKSDCADGEICCLEVTDLSGDFTITCQHGPTCPTGGLAHAQICKTNAECGAGGTCSIWSCNGQTTEACSAPSSVDCSQE